MIYEYGYSISKYGNHPIKYIESIVPCLEILRAP